ncbi:alpha/beta hydrolase [Kutzneria sp. CA-103260]|uniref:alpha/beta hydrolase n=1 Tax=Kutzneria sp. CA-103260 TaxID=2802641 RepID=UPI001BA5CB14|nr:alpha/beta hydrolase [Kutzneria sp. CA-103260]
MVLVHGAWHGPWCWDGVREQLAAVGISSTAVTLTSSGPQLGGLQDDIAAVHARLDQLDGPFVLVGHSYGGIPMTSVAATRSDVRHAVYVCAFAIPAGESLLSAVGGTPPEWWVIAEDQRTVTPDDPRKVFFNASDPDPAPQLTPQSMRSFREPLGEAAYGRVPATYVICERDAAMPPLLQEEMAKGIGAAAARLDADHSPWLGRPAELAKIIAGSTQE